ncbi:MAG: class I SAM-dependent methyltransferase [Candidatus Hydrogenedentes bacterium]|nr:class I SAM-dependent methyltransferase [Candidatus Hydrogenedentota bacterium]
MTTNGNQRLSFGDYYSSPGGGRLFRWLDWAKVRKTASLVKALGNAPRILDLGCGAAAVSGRIARDFPQAKILGADIDAKLLAAAKLRGLEVHQVDFDKPLPFDDASFDLIVMVDSIEHVRCRRDTMVQVMRLLKPEGTLLVFTPPYDTFTWWLGERLFRLMTRRPTDHVSPFTRESLDWLLGENFEEVRTGYLNFGLTMWGTGTRKRGNH